MKETKIAINYQLNLQLLDIISANFTIMLFLQITFTASLLIISCCIFNLRQQRI